MEQTKSFLYSKTLWANLIGCACFLLSLVGIDTCGIDKSALTETILNSITVLSFVFSTVWRFGASAKLIFK